MRPCPSAAVMLAAAACAVTGCGGGAGTAATMTGTSRPVTASETRAALQHAVVGRCRPAGGDARRWRCRLPRFGGAVAEVRIDDHGTFESGPLPIPPARRETVSAGLGGLPRRLPRHASGGVTEIWGCCVPVPPRSR